MIPPHDSAGPVAAPSAAPANSSMTLTGVENHFGVFIDLNADGAGFPSYTRSGDLNVRLGPTVADTAANVVITIDGHPYEWVDALGNGFGDKQLEATAPQPAYHTTLAVMTGQLTAIAATGVPPVGGETIVITSPYTA